MWKNILPHVHGWMIIMDENDWWNILMDEQYKWMGTKMDEKPKYKNKIKWMKNSNGWTKLQNQELCANVNYNLFTTKRFVLTKTLPIHLQEVCSHWELKEYEVAHFNTISHCFIFEFNLSNLLHLKSFLPLEEKNYILFPISTWTY